MMSSDKCQVCSKQSHGIHHGAVTCRACAAFFRRAILKNYDQMGCMGGDDSCEEQLEQCKKCRLKKCLKSGMTDERLQIGRDPMSSTVKTTIPPSLQYFIGRPSFILSCEPETNIRTTIDFTNLLEKASSMLASTSKAYVGMNTLNQLTNACTKTSEGPRNSYRRIGKAESIRLWETGFLEVTHWFTQCEKFQENLPLNMRMEFIKIVWGAWSHLFMDVKTANNQIRKENEKAKKLSLSDGGVVDVDKVELDTSWFAKENFLGPMKRYYTSTLVEELIKLRPTPQETTYILSVFSFRHAARMFRGEFDALNETMLETLANELHSYYINDLKLNQYGHRITKMMKIINIFEHNVYERIRKMELAREFEIMRVEFSHPEIIYGRK